MHHLKETVIDGVKFVLIPEELHDMLVDIVNRGTMSGSHLCVKAFMKWQSYDPEIFNGL